MGPRQRLIEYIEAVREVHFAWGVHDCLTFTNNAFRSMYGSGWADDWLGRYMVDGKPMRRDQLRKEFKFSTFEQAVDQRLQRIDRVPPLGALIMTQQARRFAIGGAMGISTGSKGVFLSKEGVLFLPLDAISKAWVKR